MPTDENCTLTAHLGYLGLDDLRMAVAVFTVTKVTTSELLAVDNVIPTYVAAA